MLILGSTLCMFPPSKWHLCRRCLPLSKPRRNEHRTAAGRNRNEIL